MHVAQLETDVMLCAENMHSERGLVHEVHWIGSRRNVVIREQDSAGQFEVRRNAPVADEIPFQSQRIESRAVRLIRRLESEENRNGVESILESPAQKSGKVRSGKNPSIAQSGVEDTRVAPASSDRVTSARPDLDFVPTFFGSFLRTQSCT